MTLPAGVTDEMVEAGARALWRSSMYLGYNDATLESEWVRMSGIWRNQVRSILTAALAGRVVVPREPTLAMLQAGDNSIDGSAGRIYRAMIAAAVDGGANG